MNKEQIKARIDELDVYLKNSEENKKEAKQIYKETEELRAAIIKLYEQNPDLLPEIFEDENVGSKGE